MASGEEYPEFVLDLLRDVLAIAHRKMMGEYLPYSEGVLFGGVYDDRLLLKDTPTARAAFSSKQIPYEGAKAMLLVDIENPGETAGMIANMMSEIQNPRKKR